LRLREAVVSFELLLQAGCLLYPLIKMTTNFISAFKGWAIIKCPFKGANDNSPPFQRRVRGGIPFSARFIFLSSLRDANVILDHPI